MTHGSVVKSLRQGVIVHDFIAGHLVVGVGGVLVEELVLGQGQASDLEQQAPVHLVVFGVETLKYLESDDFGVVKCFFLRGWISAGSCCQVCVGDHVLVRVFDRTALSGEQECLVEEAGDAVHLDYVLDVMLLGETLHCQLELAVLVDLSLELFFEAAKANAEEDFGAEADLELLSAPHVLLERLLRSRDFLLKRRSTFLALPHTRFAVECGPHHRLVFGEFMVHTCQDF